MRKIFNRFRRVMTVEINYSDPDGAPLVSPRNRRRPQLARILRERTLIDIGDTRIDHETHFDIGGWSEVPGHPLPPGRIVKELRRCLEEVGSRPAAA